MDAKEAIKILNSHPIWCSEYPYQKCAEATDLGIEALEKVETLEAENARLREKETPKEATTIESNWHYYCPQCGKEITTLVFNTEKMSHEQMPSKFCPFCGQAIKNVKE